MSISRRQIPNLLTFARVLAVPVCLALILLQSSGASLSLLVIFVLACLTDFFDGYLARKWDVVSPLGALLDPIADKLLVAVVLLYLLCVMGTGLFLPVTVIMLRELYVSGLREFLASRQIALPVSRGGKWKTALQMVAITVLLVAVNLHSDVTMDVAVAGLGLLYVSALLAVISAFHYTRASLPHLRG